jgi:hypothetical protein
MADGIPARLTRAEARRFAFTVGVAFAALAGLLWWRGRTLLPVAFGAISTALILAGIVIPDRLDPVYRRWMAFALAISKVTTPIFMTIVFALVITPVGLLMRALGKKPLTHAAHEDSYWILRPEGSRRSPLDRLF